MTLIKADPDRVYTRKELEVFSLLEHPIWVFDIQNSSMWYGNESSLRNVWNAATLEELLARDYKSDMSEATKQRLLDTIPRLEAGEILKEMWTCYPQGKAATMRITGSAIRIDDGRIAVIYEAEIRNDDIDHSAVRGVEMLRHLPIAVCQFEMAGHLEYQNPEARIVFGTPKEEGGSCSHFLSRFVDREVGKSALAQVQAGNDYKVDAECYTEDGTRWFSLAIRRTKDPVTSEYIILYSARDITEIIQARKATTQANLKSEFVSLIAHELRTPLHQIASYLDLLAETELSDSQRGLVKEAVNSELLLLTLVNDLLDYSKLESGKLQIENVPFALDDVHSGCIAAMATECELNGLTITKAIAGDLPAKILGDPNRIRQILMNLLSNAVKFTPTGGKITLSANIVKSTAADGTGGRLRVEVADTGVGIAPEHQTRLFQKYQQAHAAVARNYGGTGLGLAICKGLVNAMGGIIGLESELDKGTTIYFEVPFDTPSLAAESSLPTTSCGSFCDSRDNLRILVVEDNKINQKVARRMLEKFGYAVTIAGNGQLALDELRRDSNYDLALVDIMMPVMDGVECTKNIRKVLGLSERKLPIIGLTASFQHADLDYYRKLGMNDCFGKPLRMADLKTAILTNMKRASTNLLDQ